VTIEVELPEQWRATSHRIDLRGIHGEVHYVDFGDPAEICGDRTEASGGPSERPAPTKAPAVLVHGLGGSYVNWVALGPLLAKNRRVFALDLPGFGRSEPLGRSARVRSNAAVLAAFVERVAGAPPLIIGNSMGGMLSIIYASTHETTGVALIDPVLPRVAGQPLDREVAAAFVAYGIPGIGTRLLARARARTTPEETVRQIMEVVCADPSAVPPDLLAASAELIGARSATPGIDRAYLQAARSLLGVGARARSYRATMAAIKAPVLLVHGARDRLVPVQAARVAAKAFPDWTYLELPDAGHVPHMEAAAEVAASIGAWEASASVA
jgi:pimeloyl-ACP methyl ester carboxylesterase